MGSVASSAFAPRSIVLIVFTRAATRESTFSEMRFAVCETAVTYLVADSCCDRETRQDCSWVRQASVTIWKTSHPIAKTAARSRRTKHAIRRSQDISFFSFSDGGAA